MSVVIGTAKGEAHDALKNIIAAALAEDGYRVSDLGLGVPLWEFLAAIEQTGSRVVIVCVETLVALPDVALIRERLARRGRDDVVLLVAGGPFAADPQLARSSGANGVITGASSAMRALSRVAADLLDGGRA